MENNFDYKEEIRKGWHDYYKYLKHIEKVGAGYIEDACPYLKREFPHLTHKQAKEILKFWIDNYDDICSLFYWDIVKQNALFERGTIKSGRKIEEENMNDNKLSYEELVLLKAISNTTLSMRGRKKDEDGIKLWERIINKLDVKIKEKNDEKHRCL